MVNYDVVAKSTALLVIDMINDFVAEDSGSPAEVAAARDIVPVLDRLICAARAAEMLVVYFVVEREPDGSNMGRFADTQPWLVDAERRPVICVKGTRGTEIYAPLAPEASDIVIAKTRNSGFTGTRLASVLEDHGIDTVIITGLAANGCCRATTQDAFEQGFKVIYVSDGVATIDLPDCGWGPVTTDEAMRVLLTELTYVAEVTSSSDLLNRVAAAS